MFGRGGLEMKGEKAVGARMFFGLLLVGLIFSSGLGIAEVTPHGLVFDSGPSAAKLIPQEGMTQGEFAVFLVKVLDAEGFLPEAAVINDAIVFLENLGVEPPDGWDADKVLVKDDLVYMLGLEKAGKLTFTELLEMLKKRLREMLWARTGLRQSISPVSP